MTLTDSFRTLLPKMGIDTRYGRIRTAKLEYLSEVNKKELKSAQISYCVSILGGLIGLMIGIGIIEYLSDYSALSWFLAIPLTVIWLWSTALGFTSGSKIEYMISQVPDSVVDGLYDDCPESMKVKA